MTGFEGLAVRLLYVVVAAALTAAAGVFTDLVKPPDSVVHLPCVAIRTSPTSSSTDVGHLQKVPDVGASPGDTVSDLDTDVLSPVGGVSCSLQHTSRG